MENGDYIVAIDLGTNTVVAMIGTKGEDGRIRVIDREVSAVQGAGMIRGEIQNSYTYEHDYLVEKVLLAASGYTQWR